MSEGNESDDAPVDIDAEIEELISAEVNDEYDIVFDEETERIAEYGSLMVSLRIVANQMQTWTENGVLPTRDELEEKSRMLQEALRETPTDDLEPEKKKFDRRMKDIVDYAEELLMHLQNLKSARTIVNEAHDRIVRYEREFELLRDD